MWRVFAMRCWQCFLLPHFSRGIDADVNVAAASSSKFWRKRYISSCCAGAINTVSWMKKSSRLPCSALLSCESRVLSSCRDTSPCCAEVKRPCGADASHALLRHSQALLAVRGWLLASFPGESTRRFCKPVIFSI